MEELKVAIQHSDARAIDSIVGILSEVGHETRDKHLFNELEMAKGEGMKELERLEQAWSARQRDLQDEEAGNMRHLLEGANQFLAFEGKLDDDYASYLRDLRDELAKADLLLSTKFLDHTPSIQQGSLVDQVRHGRLVFNELQWKSSEMSAQLRLHQRAQAALEAKSDDDREHSREALHGCVNEMQQLLNDAPTETETGKLIVKGARAAFDKGRHLIERLEDLYQEDLKERESRRPHWVDDDASKRCQKCDERFIPMWRHRHHCRQCGSLVCDDCSKGRKRVPELKYFDEQRVCNECIGHALDFEVKAFPQELWHSIPDASPFE